ncbi:MAG: hypothetical protein OEX81_01575 [Candidatus Pacebacteria bacterium]|nr:hypothetical protein [Candidatus Paceibacterota bacterium]
MTEQTREVFLEKQGIKMIPEGDRRLVGLPCHEELKKEKGFTPLEYRGYVFLFVFTNDKYQNRFIDIVRSLIPRMDQVVDLDTKEIEKTGHDIGSLCHTTSDALALDNPNVETVTIHANPNPLKVKQSHSLVKVDLGDGSIATFDPTRPHRGLHDPLDASTYELPESQISPLVLIGEEDNIWKTFQGFYEAENNPFKTKRSFLSLRGRH